MSKYALVTVGAALLIASALAIDPVGNAQFNVTPGELDLKALTAQNFMDRVVTAAKKQGTLTFYDFTESFSPLFKDNVLPRFEKKYGISVKYLTVDGANAARLLPADQYPSLSRARINGDLSSAAQARFTTDILQGK